MREAFIDFVEEHNYLSGIIFLVLAVIIAVYQLKTKESFKMKDHNVLSWKAFVNIWVVVCILLMLGFTLIFVAPAGL